MSDLAGSTEDPEVRVQALSTMANALFLNSSLRESWNPDRFLTDLLANDKVSSSFGSEDENMQHFALFRILFMLSFTGRKYREDQIAALAELSKLAIETRHPRRQPGWFPECLKFAATLEVNYPDTSKTLIEAIPKLLKLIGVQPEVHSPEFLVTAGNFLAISKEFTWALEPEALATVLGLVRALIKASDNKDENLSPALSLLFHVTETAVNTGNPELIQTLKTTVLPKERYVTSQASTQIGQQTNTSGEGNFSDLLLKLTELHDIPVSTRLLFETSWILCDQDSMFAAESLSLSTGRHCPPPVNKNIATSLTQTNKQKKSSSTNLGLGSRPDFCWHSRLIATEVASRSSSSRQIRTT